MQPSDPRQSDLFSNSSPLSISKKQPSRPPPNIEPNWLNAMRDVFENPHMKTLREFLLEEKKHFTIYPESKNIFRAFWAAPFDQVRVVILGQDPYHGRGQAHGLAFSVQKGIPIPPSLQNIFREIHADLQIPFPSHGCLNSWAEQGILLLNTVLTVREHQAHSHANKGWEFFTDRAIFELSKEKENLVFVLWGRQAQAKIRLIDAKKHVILKASHPSPLSAHQGFLGCHHFSEINAHLEQVGSKAVDWSLI